MVPRCKGPVQHISTRPVLVAIKRAPIGWRQRVSHDLKHLARRQIEQDNWGRRKLSQGSDWRAGNDRTSQGAEVGGQRIRESLTAASRDLPAHGVPGRRQDESNGR